MKCPNCNSDNIRVVRKLKRDVIVRRRRECFDCGYRFNTVERYVPERNENGQRRTDRD